MKKLIFCLTFLLSFGIFAQEPILNKTEMCKLLTEMRNKDQLYRNSDILKSTMWNKDKYTKKEIDSVWSLQLKIDNKNTEKLIELTHKHGWLSDEITNCPELNIWIIFRHSQEKYFEKISKLIEKEHNAKRLNDWHYRLINNHLNGRPKEID